jgi:hypothetical protein
MANTVLAQLLRKNNWDYECVHQESILCSDSVVEGIYWRVPVISGLGVLSGFRYEISESKPSDDAVKAVRVRDRKNNITYYVAVADNADASVFTEACNACCDGDTELATVALPEPIIEEVGCADEDGDIDYFAIVPETVEATEVYMLSGSINGEALPAAPDAGFADLAALETWADANWNSGGVTGVTLSDASDDMKKVTLNGDDTTLTGAINIVVKRIFESNTPGALTSGQNYVLNATINGNVLAAIEGADDAALSTVATLANNTAAYAAYGVWSVVSGKIRLVTDAVSATLAVTKV